MFLRVIYPPIHGIMEFWNSENEPIRFCSLQDAPAAIMPDDDLAFRPSGIKITTDDGFRSKIGK
jgi:hypothetical protein